MSADYVAHLASSGDARFTACGEPWQGWQDDEAGTLQSAALRAGHGYLPPHRKPGTGSLIRQCQACRTAAEARG